VDEFFFSVPIINDSEFNEPAETFGVQLSNPRGAQGMILAAPSRGTVTILDDDGASRISFARAEFSQFENRNTLRVTVIRQGNDTATASVTVTAADGTAQSPSDYEFNQTTPLNFGANERSKTTTISLTDDDIGEPEESLTVSLSSPSGATLVEPSTATVRILDDDSGSSDTIDPVTAFHIPRNGKTYGPRHIATKQVHMSPSDEGSGIAKVELAARKKLRNGSCRWWNDERWIKRSCSSKKWLNMPLNVQCPHPDRCFLIYTFDDRLKPTTRKTGIRNYTAWTRSTDNAGNRENDFDPGRNKSTYWIKPR
jgi:hypothetical protein